MPRVFRTLRGGGRGVAIEVMVVAAFVLFAIAVAAAADLLTGR